MEGTFSVGCMIFSKNIKVWPNIGCWWKSIPGIVGGRRLADEIPGLSQQRGTTAKSAKKQTYQIVFSRKYSVIISCSKPFLFLGQKSEKDIDWTGLENKVFTNRGFIHFDLDSGLCQQITTASSSKVLIGRLWSLIDLMRVVTLSRHPRRWVVAGWCRIGASSFLSDWSDRQIARKPVSNWDNWPQSDWSGDRGPSVSWHLITGCPTTLLLLRFILFHSPPFALRPKAGI